MWWRRRDQGVLGAPKVLANPRFSIGLAVLVVALGIYLPMFGVSLLFVLLLEKAILSRIPRVRDWLGLYDVSGSPATLRTASVIALLSVAAGLSGCGGARPVTGGTEGTLRAGGEAISDVQVTMHEAEGATFHAVGFAVTGLDGRFQLVTSGAKGPLRLAAGEYRCTLESAGAPVEIPPEYAKPETSPLKIVWSAGDRSLNLEINPAR
jgi:hypothetical protein